MKKIAKKGGLLLGVRFVTVIVFEFEVLLFFLGEKKQFKQQSSKKHVWFFFGGMVILKFIDE